MERREVFVVLRADVGAVLQEQTDHVVMAVKYRHVQRSVAGGCLHVHAQGLVSSHLSLRKEKVKRTLSFFQAPCTFVYSGTTAAWNP